jgi:hypothetical protein
MKASLLERILISKRKRIQRLKEHIVGYLSAIPEKEISADQLEVLEYLKQHDLAVFPYTFTNQYKPEDIELHYDPAVKLLYTHWEGGKLYYKSGTQKRKAKKYFNSLRLEQDIQSPHRYLTDAFHVSENDVILDIGAAEGNFSLSVVHKAKHIYLFEPDKAWVKALMATFAPWRDKVTIVKKFISDKTSDKSITVDDFLPDNQPVNFIKADVEGTEYQLLEGAKKTIARQQELKLAICTYHQQDDADKINKLLQELGFATAFSRGYMLYYYGRENIVQPPYLRKAVVRATKTL